MSDRASSPPPAPTQERPESANIEVQVKEEESLILPSSATSVAQTEAARIEANSEAPSVSPGRAGRKTDKQRRAYLRNDPYVQEVEPHRVLCRDCQKWIKLSMSSTYALANWQGHVQRCHGSTPDNRRTPSKPSFSPGSRVATAERKIVLLNDPQVRSCSPRHVQCGTCKTLVALEGEVEYDLTKWTEHKEKCIPMTPAPITPQGSTPHGSRVFPPPSSSSAHSHASVGRSARSPTPVGEAPSSNSTETTVVTESSPTAVKVGTKRRREEEREDGEEAGSERPSNRARTETYRPPEGSTPTLLGLLIQPLKEFARGFREGLGST